MNQLNKKNNHGIKPRQIILLIGIIAVCITAIISFLPHDGGSQFRYDIGRPWMYNSLIARFDFPIYKTDETIKNEQDSILRSFQPYYNYDRNIEKERITRLKQDFPQGINGLPHNIQSILLDKLHRLYTKGIIAKAQYNELSKDTTQMIRIINGKRARSIKVNELYNTMNAYETLLSQTKLLPYRNILQQISIVDYIQPNIIYDKNRSETERSDLLSSIPLASGMVLSGQKIIDQGDIVNANTYRILSSFEKETERRNSSTREINTVMAGQILLVAIMLTLFTTYICLFRADYLEKPRSLTMLYTLIVLFPIIISLMVGRAILSVYIIPMAIGPIFIRMFMDTRTAFITHIVTVFICALALKHSLEFILVQYTGGIVAIYSLRELTSRAQIIKTSLFVFIANASVYFSLQLIQTGLSENVDFSMYRYFVISGVLLLLAYPLMYIIERTFGFTSNVTLFELSNTNKGILRKMSEVAPGTFQHSITVGNLAAEIAHQIGANSLLVRTGALYHDIGKIERPAFFTENQVGTDPHKGMSYKASAKIIIDHVIDGAKIADKENLPSVLKDFILTHHGKGVVKYFFIKYCNEHPDEEVNRSDFSYPGPDPYTREQAILMMADTIEAASHSLKEYTDESITNLVDKLIDIQVSEGHFQYCPITFQDIAIAKAVLIDKLKSIYHTRISYPEMKK